MAKGSNTKPQRETEQVSSPPPSIQAPKKIPALFFMPEESIGFNHLKEVKNKVSKVSNEKLYLIIKTYGGDVYSAVRIIKHLKTLYPSIIGVVPEYAYSAGTIMLLGSNNILPSAIGSIGPIDVPAEHSATGEAISALDVTQSIPNIASLLSTSANDFYNAIRSLDNISKKDAMEIAWKSAVGITSPLVEKIDPVLLQKSYRDLRIGRYYGIDLLSMGMFKGDVDTAAQVTNDLINFFPSHGYAIFRNHMRMVGLKVDNFEDSTDYGRIMELYNGLSNAIMFKEDIYAK